MTPRPMFSICIPNYNYGHFIQGTIQSVLDQSYQDFEIIVADNASTDDSVARVEQLDSDKVRLVRNRYNIGFAPNLQRATESARGRFMNLLSSDDQMKPGALATYAKVIEESGADPDRLLLASDADAVDLEGRVLNTRRNVGGGSFVKESVSPETRSLERPLFDLYPGRVALLDRIPVLHTMADFCTLMYPRSMWDRVEGYNAVRTIAPDRFFEYKLLALDPTVAYINRSLYRYREYVSDNRAAINTTIRFPIDDYLDVLEFGNSEFLDPVGLRREDLVEAFMKSVVGGGLVQLGEGNASLARRYLAFALATFPKEAMRRSDTYKLGALVATGPLAGRIGPLLRARYVRRRDRRASGSP